MGHFLRAIELDPGFASPWADLAEIRLVEFDFAGTRPGESRRLAKAAAQNALEIDDSIGEAHATLGEILWMDEFDWGGAESQLRRAIEFAPYSGRIHQQYSKLLLAMGRQGEALTSSNRAEQLDPLSPGAHAWTANVRFVSGSYENAIEEARNALVLDSGFGLGRLVLGRSYIQMGRYEQGLAELEKARQLLEGNWRPLGDLAYSYAIAAQTSKARALLEEMLTQSRTTYFPALPIALAYTGLGDRDHALKWLRRATEERSSELWLKSDPRLIVLRSESRFAAITDSMKLP